ncbi:hypothetical protein Tco_0329018 [Tanacetum coccineum]
MISPIEIVLALRLKVSLIPVTVRVTTLEKEVAELKKDPLHTQVIALVDDHLDARPGATIDEFMNFLLASLTTRITEQMVKESLEEAVLAKVSSQPQTSYEATATLTEFELKKILIDKMDKNKDKDEDPSAGSDRGLKKRKTSKDTEPTKKVRNAKDQEENPEPTDPDWNFGKTPQQGQTRQSSQATRAEEPQTSFNELMDTSFDFSAFVLNRLNITDLTQEILVGPAFNLMKGTYHRGRQVIPQDYFINNDLEYLKGGDLSKRYSTSVTKTKVATYEIKWFKDLVRNLWVSEKVTYDKHAYLGISHWRPKRQRFYGYARNLTSSKDVYSIRRIITVTRLTIEKNYDYDHLEEIKVRKHDQQLYTFKEFNFL